MIDSIGPSHLGQVEVGEIFRLAQASRVSNLFLATSHIKVLMRGGRFIDQIFFQGKVVGNWVEEKLISSFYREST